MAIIKKDGFPFMFNQEICSLCEARCCRGSSGNIWVNSKDIGKICDLLGVNLIDGINNYFQKKDNQYSIREHIAHQSFDDKDFCCVFLDKNNRCSIYPVRPVQCKTFPFWTIFKQDMEKLVRDCPAVFHFKEP